MAFIKESDFKPIQGRVAGLARLVGLVVSTQEMEGSLCREQAVDMVFAAASVPG